jgi:hypothetical protein
VLVVPDGGMLMVSRMVCSLMAAVMGGNLNREFVRNGAFRRFEVNNEQ